MQKSQNCSCISTDILEETMSHEFNTCMHAWQDYPLRLPESLGLNPKSGVSKGLYMKSKEFNYKSQDLMLAF